MGGAARLFRRKIGIPARKKKILQTATKPGKKTYMASLSPMLSPGEVWRGVARVMYGTCGYGYAVVWLERQTNDRI